jgi:hypothetical protein
MDAELGNTMPSDVQVNRRAVRSSTPKAISAIKKARRIVAAGIVGGQSLATPRPAKDALEQPSHFIKSGGRSVSNKPTFLWHSGRVGHT